MKFPLLLTLLILFSPSTQGAEPTPLADEPLLFTGETKATATGQLLKIPTAAPKLKSGDCSIEFELGKDYTWQEGTRVVTLTAESRIPFMTNAALHPAPNSPNSYKAQRDSDKWMFFGPGRVLHELQPTATYSSTEDWAPPKIDAAIDEQLGSLRKQLRAKEALKVVMLGDSISTGLDASAGVDVAPRQPGYPTLVVNALETTFGSKCTLINLAKIGMDAAWGLNQVPAVLEAKPDLLLLAFGMNDASGRRKPEEFARITQEIIKAVHAGQPTCTVILISPMTANREWTGATPELYPQYATALEKLAAPNVAVANVTATWTAIAERKRYLDLSGNGLNHPNDYGHRIYEDVILRTIGQKAR